MTLSPAQFGAHVWWWANHTQNDNAGRDNYMPGTAKTASQVSRPGGFNANGPKNRPAARRPSGRAGVRP